MTSDQTMEIQKGWREHGFGGRLTCDDPVDGGVIDVEPSSGRWFVEFNNRKLSKVSGLPSRDEAVWAMTAITRAVRRYSATGNLS